MLDKVIKTRDNPTDRQTDRQGYRLNVVIV